mmetsp:Transcript_79613/g.165370  ORF Transcript_79613/g.165370 Transcript_79613/m.165370 type:complete len:259 (+) Transcript_79613:393-1169(+)
MTFPCFLDDQKDSFWPENALNILFRQATDAIERYVQTHIQVALVPGVLRDFRGQLQSFTLRAEVFLRNHVFRNSGRLPPILCCHCPRHIAVRCRRPLSCGWCSCCSSRSRSRSSGCSSGCWRWWCCRPGRRRCGSRSCRVSIRGGSLGGTWGCVNKVLRLPAQSLQKLATPLTSHRGLRPESPQLLLATRLCATSQQLLTNFLLAFSQGGGAQDLLNVREDAVGATEREGADGAALDRGPAEPCSMVLEVLGEAGLVC